jgi:hypothetical protein
MTVTKKDPNDIPLAHKVIGYPIMAWLILCVLFIIAAPFLFIGMAVIGALVGH